jgi:hypothetical protein
MISIDHGRQSRKPGFGFLSQESEMNFVARVGGFLGRLRLGVGSGFAVGTVAAGLLLAAAVGPPAALASANLNWGTGTKGV